MIYLLGNYEQAVIAFLGVLFAFAVTCIAIAKLNRFLPKDMGRQYAHDGALSAGKPRGAGIIFVLVFVAAALLFGKMNREIFFYLILIVVEMFTGFFDDAADKPWGHEFLRHIERTKVIVHGKEAMEHLREIGTVVYLEVSFPVLEKRLADIKGRGVVLKEGQNLYDLYLERTPLYESYADIRIAETGLDIEQTVEQIVSQLQQDGIK